MTITRFKNIDPSELDSPVWRYMPFSKFISLLSYGALWFSKLKILEDRYEGSMPSKIDAQMRGDHRKLKRHLHPSIHEQIDDVNARNVEDGRELTVVNCWFGAKIESERMWREYARDAEGIATRSTIRSLSQYVYCDQQFSQIGRVRYVELNNHMMSACEANQAQERALLKSLEYKHEEEIRILTMSFRGPMCVGMDGTPLTEEDWKGADMNNFDNPGLYIRANLRKMIHATVLAPGSSTWFELMVKHIAREAAIGPVERSTLD
jgi:hypothetical protein